MTTGTCIPRAADTDDETILRRLLALDLERVGEAAMDARSQKSSQPAT